MDIIMLEDKKTKFDVILETESELSENDLKELFSSPNMSMVNITLIPEKVRELCKKWQIKTVNVDGKEYEYMLSQEAYNKAFGEVSIDSLSNNLKIRGFEINDGYIYSSNKKIAKYNSIYRWLQLPPNTKELNKQLIFSFPGTFSVYIGKYTIKNEDLKELLFCGIKEVDLKYWRKCEE